MRAPVALSLLLAFACSKKDEAARDLAEDVVKEKAREALDGYKGKSKVSETTANLKKLHAGARAYYQEERFEPGGLTVATPRFPASAPLSPPLGACCEQGGKCKPDAKHWEHPTWHALQFAMDDPHYYSYEFVSEGEGKDARFTARAIGDLDCDGIFATFEIAGRVDESGEVSGSTSMFKNNELE